jgi:hypothetical protein
MNKVWLEPCSRSRWTDFAPYHYMEEELNKSSRTFLAYAVVDGVTREVGFAASLPRPSGTMRNTFGEHKIVARLSQGPREKLLWAEIADALAILHVNEGKRWFGHAPIEYAGYRDEIGSGWAPTTKHKAWLLRGRGSHEFVGAT